MLCRTSQTLTRVQGTHNRYYRGMRIFAEVAWTTNGLTNTPSISAKTQCIARMTADRATQCVTVLTFKSFELQQVLTMVFPEKGLKMRLTSGILEAPFHSPE